MSIYNIFLFLIGLGLLVVGAEMVVRGASRLALLLGVKPLMIGITVVAVGSSTPELAIGLTAGMNGSGELAVGNIAGVNILNILFILGLSAAIVPIALQSQILKLELPVIVLSALAMGLLSLDGILSAIDGGVLVFGAFAYTVFVIRASRREPEEVVGEYEDMYGDEPDPNLESEKETRGKTHSNIKNALLLVAGIVITIFGANQLVTGAVEIARSLGITETIIGLTIVAFGTAAPELTTSIIGIIRNDRDVAVGNILGSTIYNVLLILGIVAIAAPGGLPVSREVLLIDISLMALVALVCIPIFITGKRITRVEGILFVAAYIVYLLSIIFFRA